MKPLKHEISVEAVKNAAYQLANLPKINNRVKPFSLTEAINSMSETIIEKFEQGYSNAEIADVILTSLNMKSGQYTINIIKKITDMHLYHKKEHQYNPDLA